MLGLNARGSIFLCDKEKSFQLFSFICKLFLLISANISLYSFGSINSFIIIVATLAGHNPVFTAAQTIGSNVIISSINDELLHSNTELFHFS